MIAGRPVFLGTSGWPPGRARCLRQEADVDLKPVGSRWHGDAIYRLLDALAPAAACVKVSGDQVASGAVFTAD